MKTFFSAFLSLSVSFVVAAANAEAPGRDLAEIGRKQQRHLGRASEVASKIAVSVSPSRQGRSLQGLTYTEFKTFVCDPYEQDFLAGLASYETGSCDCATPTQYGITCRVDEVCVFGDPGCDATVCTTYTTVTTFYISAGYLLISSIEGTWVITGADYTGARILVYENAVGNLDCEQYYSIGNQEYQCLECSYCDEEGTSLHLDCSNIQPTATTNGCIVLDETEINDVDLCLDGDAPIPGSGSTPTTSGGSSPTPFPTPSPTRFPTPSPTPFPTSGAAPVSVPVPTEPPTAPVSNPTPLVFPTEPPAAPTATAGVESATSAATAVPAMAVAVLAAAAGVALN